jgi:hypothetical protein
MGNLIWYLTNWFKPVKQPAGLISILLDETNPDRDDAAHNLANYNQEEVEAALAQVALDPRTDDDMADACGESLATIWCRKGRLNLEILSSLNGVALRLAVGVIKKYKPEWETQVREVLGQNPARAAEWDNA